MKLTSGIYVVIHRTTGDRYMGSSVDIAARWREHRCDLVNGCHGNWRLQQDFDAGGIDVFEFTVLEDLGVGVEYDLLLLVEQMWINFCVPEYNIVRDVFSGVSPDRSKKWIVMTPDGQEHEVTNLYGYCRERGLCAPNMIKVATGKIGQTGGYRCRYPQDETYRFVRKSSNRGSINAGKALVKKYSIEYPDGKVEDVLGLNAFCHRHGLNRNSMRQAIRKGTRCMGFRGVRLPDDYGIDYHGNTVVDEHKWTSMVEIT